MYLRLTLILLLLVHNVQATIHFASDSSSSTVNALLATAGVVTGDMIVLPNVLATNTGTITIPSGKHITIAGYGTNTTALYRTGGTIINTGTTRSRVSGIRFESGTSTSDGVTGVLMQGQGIRVDNCLFISRTGVKFLAVLIRGGTGIPHPYGVIDHNQLLHNRIDVQGSVDSAFGWGNTMWASALPMGTTNQIVIENNDMRQTVTTIFTTLIDSEYGGTLTVRFCTLTDGVISGHPVGSASGINERGTRWMEIYGNTFSNVNQSISSRPIWYRAGSGLVYSNNVITTYPSSSWVTLAHMDNERGWEDGSNPSGSSYATAPGGYTNRVDGNYTYRSDTQGTHDGANNSATLELSTAAWTVNEFTIAKEVKPNGVATAYNTNLWVHNITDGSCGRITANTATSITATLAGGTDNDWDTGDAFVVTGGYPTRDQPGIYKDQTQYVSGDTYRPIQDQRPIYMWQNYLNGVAANTVTIRNNSGFWIKESRDWTNAVPNDYTRLVYPHPMVTLQGAGQAYNGSCTFSLDSSSTSIGSGGASSNFGVTTDSTCSWTAISNDAWITITGGASGTGSGPVSYTVSLNPNQAPRSGTVTVVDQTFTVNQDAYVPTFPISRGKHTTRGKINTR